MRAVIIATAACLFSSSAHGAEIKQAVDFSFHDHSDVQQVRGVCKLWASFSADDRSEMVKLYGFAFKPTSQKRLVFGFQLDVARWGGPATGAVDSDVTFVGIDSVAFHSPDHFQLKRFGAHSMIGEANSGADFMEFLKTFAAGQYDLSVSTLQQQYHAYKINAPIPEQNRLRFGQCLDMLVTLVK